MPGFFLASGYFGFTFSISQYGAISPALDVHSLSHWWPLGFEPSVSPSGKPIWAHSVWAKVEVCCHIWGKTSENNCVPCSSALIRKGRTSGGSAPETAARVMHGPQGIRKADSCSTLQIHSILKVTPEESPQCYTTPQGTEVLVSITSRTSVTPLCAFRHFPQLVCAQLTLLKAARTLGDDSRAQVWTGREELDAGTSSVSLPYSSGHATAQFQLPQHMLIAPGLDDVLL